MSNLSLSVNISAKLLRISLIPSHTSSKGNFINKRATSSLSTSTWLYDTYSNLYLRKNSSMTSSSSSREGKDLWAKLTSGWRYSDMGSIVDWNKLNNLLAVSHRDWTYQIFYMHIKNGRCSIPLIYAVYLHMFY